MLLLGPALAEDRGLPVQGVFCNTEQQVEAALSAMGAGLSPRAAVDVANRGGVFCTLVDLLHFVVEHPVIVEDDVGQALLPKYRGTLTGVIAGGRLRAVSPPAEVFFVTPQKLAAAPIERRT
jgi:hypothetical protein